MTIYNEIGKNYSLHRKPDNRIVKFAYQLLQMPQNGAVVDMGAGTGNYSNQLAENGINVYAVEPSLKMIAQSVPHKKVSWLRGIAEKIPLSDKSVYGILAILSVHHYRSIELAINEFIRILKNGSIVIFTFDPRQSEPFWLADYFPDIWKQSFSVFDGTDTIAKAIARNKLVCDIIPFPLPEDLTDKFMASGWKHPEIYLDEQVRKSMSPFALADQQDVISGISKLRKDLDSGAWDKDYGFIRKKREMDLGYRFIKISK